MKKLLLLCFLCVFSATAIYAQDGSSRENPAKDSQTPPYMKYRKLPAFNVRLMDSVTIFNTYNIPSGKITGLLLFDPDCSHCKRTMARLVKGMDSLKNVQFYLLTPVHSMTMVRDFYKKFHLARFKNIKIVGRDYNFFFADYYKVMSVPDLALYDKHKDFMTLIKGEFTVADVYKYTHG